MVARQSITQEAFDEAVAANIDEFGMEEDEAVASAVEEFELQGLDLSGVARRGPTSKAENPLAALTAQLRDALLGKPSAAVAAALIAIRNCLAGQKAEELAASLAVAGEEGTILLVLEALAADDCPPEMQLAALQALRLLLGTQKTRAQFGSSAGAAAAVLACARDHAGTEGMVQAVAEAAEAATTADEGNKTAFMVAEIGQLFADCLPQAPPAAVRAMCRAVRKLTTADDSRPTVSRAFQNSRALAQDGLHLAFLAAVSRSDAAGDTAAACCQAVKKLAANEELCTEVADAGGVETALQVLQGRPESAACAAAAAGLLRQLAGSDALKQRIVAAGALPALAAALYRHGGSPAAAEQALGLAAAITLRAPDIAAAAMAAGLPEAILQVMRGSQQQWVQRQACMALRNLGARSPEARPPLLALGAESALRDARTRFPEACGDVGAAALRDLGVEDYS